MKNSQLIYKSSMTEINEMKDVAEHQLGYIKELLIKILRVNSFEKEHLEKHLQKVTSKRAFFDKLKGQITDSSINTQRDEDCFKYIQKRLEQEEDIIAIES